MVFIESDVVFVNEQKYDKKTHTSQFYVLEIHAFTRVTALDNRDPPPRFCVCSHTGSVEDAQVSSGEKKTLKKCES